MMRRAKRQAGGEGALTEGEEGDEYAESQDTVNDGRYGGQVLDVDLDQLGDAITAGIFLKIKGCRNSDGERDEHADGHDPKGTHDGREQAGFDGFAGRALGEQSAN